MDQRGLRFGPLTYLGRISYGIYLYHMFVIAAVMQWIPRRMPMPGLHEFVGVLGVTVVIAAASWHLFEGPLNNLKRYFPYDGRRRTEMKLPVGILQESAT